MIKHTDSCLKTRHTGLVNVLISWGREAQCYGLCVLKEQCGEERGERKERFLLSAFQRHVWLSKWIKAAVIESDIMKRGNQDFCFGFTASAEIRNQLMSNPFKCEDECTGPGNVDKTSASFFIVHVGYTRIELSETSRDFCRLRLGYLKRSSSASIHSCALNWFSSIPAFAQLIWASDCLSERCRTRCKRN